MKIVSLLPSTTEILFAIGAGEDVVGVSSDCDFPFEARTRRVVSASRLDAGLALADVDAAVREQLATGDSLYRLDERALADLDPDLIVTQDLCAVCAVEVSSVDEAVAHLGCRAAVLTVDPSSLEEVLDSIRRLGVAAARGGEADALVGSLRERLGAVSAATAGLPPRRVLVLEWTDPPFGAGHWVPDLVRHAGGVPLLAAPGGPSRRLAWAELSAADAEFVVVAPCGFHLDEASAIAQALLEAGGLPAGADVWAIDADAVVVRPGPRLVDGVEALAGVLHPETGVTTQAGSGAVVRYVGTTSQNTNPSRSST